MASPARPVIALASTTLDIRYLLPALVAAAPDADIRISPDLGATDEIDALLSWYAPLGLLGTLPRLRLAHSVAAGVDHILADPTLPAHVPVCRIIDRDMTSGMITYVSWAVIHRHRHFDAYLEQAQAGNWREGPIVPARLHRVGIAGMGVLGMAVTRALAMLGYDVAGWSSSPKADLPTGVASFHGPDQLDDFLGRSDTLVCLLPLTAATHGFLSMSLFRRLPAGAHLVNVGRGGHLIEDDLLHALDEGCLAAATLDTFNTEPLAPDHAFWRHPRITITPHVATRTSPAMVVAQFLDNLRRVDAGLPLVGLIDRHLGY